MKKIQGVEVVNPEIMPLDRGIEKHVQELNTGQFITRKVVSQGLAIPEFTGLSLGEILGEVDRYFDIIAESIDGTTVDHNWFLYPTNDTPWYMDKLGIDGHAIGSRVRVCNGSKISIATNKPLYDDLSVKLNNTSEGFLNDNGWFIPDAAKPRQFLLTGENQDEPVLVDIEPRVETPTYPPASIDLL